MLPNEQIDFFIAAHMDDAVLDKAWAGASAESQALARGAVGGYNRYLADHAGKLPAACNGQSWVRPMTLTEFRRQGELTAVQAATAALADAMLGARPPAAVAEVASPVNLADAADAMRDAGLLDSPLGSNAWAFGKDVTANGRGLLVGNPHFPWAGVNRFWQVHLTLPGSLDVMGVGIGNFPNVTIGFNKDVAWSHTVSTGKRFTLHELTLAAGDPTSYLLDGQTRQDDIAECQHSDARGGWSRANQDTYPLVHPVGAHGGDSTCGPQLDCEDCLRPEGRQPGQCARHRFGTGALAARAMWTRCGRP
jgi:acyl-homoserine-lactone acylase